jgi:penicillin-binding protein 1B
MVGGRNYSKSQFNRCTQAKRQPGSTFKPFVYLTALDAKRSPKLFTASSLLDDTQFTIESGDEPWTPRNYDEEEHGQVTLRTALEKSYNISTAKLALEVGLENVVKTARDAGIKSPLAAVPSIALGTFELAPLELAAAYTLFPNGGIRAEPIAIMHVVNKASDVLERRKIRMKRKFDSAPVFLTTSLLKGVVERGTAVGVKAFGFEGIAAGKTGTTSNYRDAWFVGFTPQLLALTWVGYDDNAETNMSGARAALPLWSFFMQKVAGQSSQDFTGPNNVVLVKVDPITGGLVSRKCPEYIYEAFVEGTEPDYLCESVYIEAKPSFEVF